MTGARIIRATRDDAALLAGLGAGTFTETFGHLYDPSDLAAFLEKSHSTAAYRRVLSDPAFAAWIVRSQDGEDVGYAVAGPCDLPVPDMPDNSGELCRLYLLRKAQGAGTGERLLSVALDWLTGRFSNIYLSVYSENYGAQRLYRRRGFEKILDYKYMVGAHSDPEWVMQLRA